MLNLHKLGLVLIVGGFMAIGSSIMAGTAKIPDPSGLTAFNALGSHSQLEEADTQLRRWSRSSYRRISQPSSPDENQPIQQLPDPTPTPVSTSPSPTSPSSNTTPASLTVVDEIILGVRNGYTDSGDRHLSKGEALSVSCNAQTLSISKSDAEWEAFCKGSNVDDHVTVWCSNNDLTAINVKSLSLLIGCDVGSNTTSAGTSVQPTSVQPAPVQPTATTQPAAPSPTPVPPTTSPTTTVPAGATSGGSVSNPRGNCIEARTPGQIIENMTIGPCGGAGIDVEAPNVIIRNVTIRQAQTNIHVYQTSGTVIENSRLENPVGANDGYVQQIGLDKVSNVTIRNNTLVCSGSACRQEDAIGVYQSSNVVISGNSITGGNSGSGCGIMADAGVSRLTITNNTIRSQVNCGIGIANGTDHLVDSNNVSGYGNVGIYVWNQYGGSCSRITIRNNTVAGNNPWWDGGNCSQLTVTGNNFDE